jgi:hypothetical protein
MKVVFGAVLLFTVSCSIATLSQDAAMAAMAACGPKDDKAKVNPDTGRDPSAQPEAGKALVYMIEDEGGSSPLAGAGITLRVGMDGSWVGAVNHRYPFLSFSVTPGTRHLCVNWQSSIELPSRMTALAHTDVQADKVYYFRVRPWGTQYQMFLDLDPIDSDMGKLLLASLSAKK